MSDEREIFEEPGDTPDTGELERLLQDARPLPSPSFRGALARLLAATPLPRVVRHWRLKAIALAAGGAILLALAGAGVAGSGPLAPSHAATATPAPDASR
jgi:hypothetical protein